MAAWIWSFRLPVCTLAGLQAVASFWVAGMDPSWLVAVAVFFIACATMLQNDWRDRYHDRRKGKVVALEHPGTFLALLLACWSICGLFLLLVVIEDNRTGIVLSLMAFAGMVYSETRLMPMVPVTLVAVTAASPSLLPAVAGASVDTVWPLFLSFVLVVFGREVTKDLDDENIDRGYKWTIPLAWGNRWAKITAAIALTVGLVVLFFVSSAVLPGILFAMIGVILLICGASPRGSRAYLDLGMALAILTLVVD
ncbi:MAG: hypothetical protein G01um101431_565 [Parcubacteria group bacterium Gr01-1014_31]|nr:MAG: hypothetical protein G01um101431_565 [Parcubacteria group bacterium Gr01-1014_31]